MPPPFYQPWVSKGGSFEKGGVNQYGIVHGLYLSQNMSLVYFDLCVHGSLVRGGQEFSFINVCEIASTPLAPLSKGGTRVQLKWKHS